MYGQEEDKNSPPNTDQSRRKEPAQLGLQDIVALSTAGSTLLAAGASIKADSTTLGASLILTGALLLGAAIIALILSLVRGRLPRWRDQTILSKFHIGRKRSIIIALGLSVPVLVLGALVYRTNVLDESGRSGQTPSQHINLSYMIPSAPLAVYDFSDANVCPLPENTYNEYDRGCEDGHYVLRGVDPTSDLMPYGRFPQTYTDVVVSADVTIKWHTGGGTAAITCRSSDKGAYYFQLNPDEGTYSLHIIDYGSEFEEQLASGKDPRIKRGSEMNHLELSCVNDHMMASVNGVQLISVVDTRLTGGSVEVLGGVDVTRLPGTSEVWFDTVTVKGEPS